MTLNQTAALCGDATFQSQIRAAAVSYAHTAVAASPTTHQAADSKKYTLAISTIADGCTANLTRFVWGIATTPGFSAATNDTNGANDAAINSAMVSQWAVIAGVTGADTGS